MRIVDTAVYSGPNVYTRHRAVRHVVDLDGLAEWPTGRLGTAFSERLLAVLPGLAEPMERDASALELMIDGDGLCLAEVMQRVALALQRNAGHDLRFGCTKPITAPHLHAVVYQYHRLPSIARRAGELALALIAQALPDALRPTQAVSQNFDAAAVITEFAGLARRRGRLALGSEAILQAAEARGIPWSSDDAGPPRLGQGRHQTRFNETHTETTSIIAVKLASNKQNTAAALDELHLPVPRQRWAENASDAASAAEQIGYPVVVKPLSEAKGNGVNVHLTNAEEAQAAFADATQYGSGVIVESFIEGKDYRLLVVGGELVAACLRIPGHVRGDGVRTIEQLLEEVNRDPRRDGRLFHPITLNADARRMLANVGYTPSSVPAAGEIVYLRSMANTSAGGTSVGVTELVHADNRELAERAARGLCLDIAGIDLIIPDISRSYREVGGGICEVNTRPGIVDLHVTPMEGSCIDVGAKIIDFLFPPGRPFRIPAAVVAGRIGNYSAAAPLAHILALAGRDVGLATRDGLWTCGERIKTGDATGAAHTRRVLRDRSVDAAVLEARPRSVLQRGLGYDNCDVAAILAQDDYRPTDPRSAMETTSEALRVVAQAATGVLVLNADDPFCSGLAAHARAARLAYVTRQPPDALLPVRAAETSLVVGLLPRDGGSVIAVRENGRTAAQVPLGQIPAVEELDYPVENLLAAVAVAKALGVSDDRLAGALRGLDREAVSTPLGLKVVDDGRRRLIIGTCRDAAEATRLVRYAERLPAVGETVLCLGFASDREGRLLLDTYEAIADRFDRRLLALDAVIATNGRDGAAQLRGAIEGRLAGRPRTTMFTSLADAIDGGLGALPSEGTLMVVTDHPGLARRRIGRWLRSRESMRWDWPEF